MRISIILLMIVGLSSFIPACGGGGGGNNDTPQDSSHESTSTNNASSNTEDHSNSSSGSDIWFLDTEQCIENDSVQFTSLPMDIDAITAIEPQGQRTGLVGGHITPGDHMGFQFPNSDESITYDVYALADGYITYVERNTVPSGFPDGVKNYHLYFEYSCTMLSNYVHITQLSQDLLDTDSDLQALDDSAEGEAPRDNFRIPVKAGQVIGKVQAYGLLGMLTVDLNVTLAGFSNPPRYDDEPWKTHAVPFFDYFENTLKNQLMEKNPRTLAPRGGKIDFDIDGRLIGNWFLEGTEYFGAEVGVFCNGFPCSYWDGHLNISYDYVDPTQIRVSIGYETGLSQSTPYGVKGNAPDPAEVSLSSELIKYELVPLIDVGAANGFATTGSPLMTENDESQILGVILFQLTEEGKLKMEVFADKTAEEVSGFTSAVRIYER